jgi:hypothetical protein
MFDDAIEVMMSSEELLLLRLPDEQDGPVVMTAKPQIKARRQRQ